MKNRSVSVVIPTYNRLPYLRELLTSLAAQTVQPDEVIIINDAGEPVGELLEEFQSLHISIEQLPENVLHVHARNRGVALATSDYMMLIDDDDWIVATHIETMLQEIEGYDLAYSDVEIVEYKIVNGSRVPVERMLFAYEYDLAEMKKFSTFIPSGCIYKRELHKHIGLFDPDMKNYWDWDFFLRVAEAGSVKRVPVAGVLYDFTPGGQNQSANLGSMRTYLDRLSLKHSLGFLPVKNFKLLLKEPEIILRQSSSQIVWNGEMPVISKVGQ
ncbi:glycosyltransferase family 2 protein [Jeotgalibacillus malaysiensis]|uniref:glycosyltransferase family 2 protein n=1 Tax=Jeotgalibacillus malaysiensis TaxID=1508404 RepID=UPI0038517213